MKLPCQSSKTVQCICTILVKNKWLYCVFILWVVVCCRPSQIACTVTTVHITCTQTALRVHKNSCTLFISLFKNRLNPIFANTPHRPLYFTKITTTSTAFLTSNTAVSNPYSHSTAFDPQSFASLSQVPGSFNRCASV